MSSEILPLIDFSKVKKKRRNKVEIKEEKEKEKETKEEEYENKEEDDDLDDVVLTKGKGGKVKKTGKKKKEKQENIIESDNNLKFSYEFLLNRIYDIMKANNPNSSSDRLKIPNIKVNITGKDRSSWVNLETVAESLNRDIESLFKYILSELGIEGTIGGDNQANFKAKVTQTSIEKVLTKYINDYVRCPTCKSFKTILKKDQSTRLLQKYCENCKSVKTVQVIKARATAGKKKK